MLSPMRSQPDLRFAAPGSYPTMAPQRMSMPNLMPVRPGSSPGFAPAYPTHATMMPASSTRSLRAPSGKTTQSSPPGSLVEPSRGSLVVPATSRGSLVAPATSRASDLVVPASSPGSLVVPAPSHGSLVAPASSPPGSLVALLASPKNGFRVERRSINGNGAALTYRPRAFLEQDRVASSRGQNDPQTAGESGAEDNSRAGQEDKDGEGGSLTATTDDSDGIAANGIAVPVEVATPRPEQMQVATPGPRKMQAPRLGSQRVLTTATLPPPQSPGVLRRASAPSSLSATLPPPSRSLGVLGPTPPPPMTTRRPRPSLPPGAPYGASPSPPMAYASSPPPMTFASGSPYPQAMATVATAPPGSPLLPVASSPSLASPMMLGSRRSLSTQSIATDALPRRNSGSLSTQSVPVAVYSAAPPTARKISFATSPPTNLRIVSDDDQDSETIECTIERAENDNFMSEDVSKKDTLNNASNNDILGFAFGYERNGKAAVGRQSETVIVDCAQSPPMAYSAPPPPADIFVSSSPAVMPMPVYATVPRPGSQVLSRPGSQVVLTQTPLSPQFPTVPPSGLLKGGRMEDLGPPGKQPRRKSEGSEAALGGSTRNLLTGASLASVSTAAPASNADLATGLQRRASSGALSRSMTAPLLSSTAPSRNGNFTFAASTTPRRSIQVPVSPREPEELQTSDLELHAVGRPGAPQPQQDKDKEEELSTLPSSFSLM